MYTCELLLQNLVYRNINVAYASSACLAAMAEPLENTSSVPFRGHGTLFSDQLGVDQREGL